MSATTTHTATGMAAASCCGPVARKSLTGLCGMQQFQKLAQELPYSKHEHSRLICPVTLEVMNEHNPPMVASDGAVYSEKAVQQIAAQNQGKFKNPQTGDPGLHQSQTVHLHAVAPTSACGVLSHAADVLAWSVETYVVLAGDVCEVSDLQRAFIS